MKFLERYSFQMKVIKDKYEHNPEIIEKYMGNSLTKTMFHSTGKMSPEFVLSQDEGFDGRYCSDENFFGYGIYFADYADYSHFNSGGLFQHISYKHRSHNILFNDKNDKNQYKMILAEVRFFNKSNFKKFISIFKI